MACLQNGTAALKGLVTQYRWNSTATVRVDTITEAIENSGPKNKPKAPTTVWCVVSHVCVCVFCFCSPSGGLVKINLKLPTLPRSHFVSCVNLALPYNTIAPVPTYLVVNKDTPVNRQKKTALQNTRLTMGSVRAFQPMLLLYYSSGIHCEASLPPFFLDLPGTGIYWRPP